MEIADDVKVGGREGCGSKRRQEKTAEGKVQKGDWKEVITGNEASLEMKGGGLKGTQKYLSTRYIFHIITQPRIIHVHYFTQYQL